MRLYYKSSKSHVIDFDAGPLAAQQPETLTRNAWGFDTITGVNGLGRIRNFYRDTWDASLVVTITADTAAEYNNIMKDMHQTFEGDIQTMSPGRLYWGDYYRECYAVETSHSNYDELLEYAEKTIRFVSVHPFWIKETQIDFVPTITPTLDFPLDLHNVNLGRSEHYRSFTLTGINSCNFELRFFGPMETPHIWIDGHLYEVDTNVDANEVLLIDSLKKTVTLYNRTGSDRNERNLFSARNRDSYIFEKIAANRSIVARWPAISNTIRLIAMDERGEPVWI